MKHAPSVSPAGDRAVSEVVRLREENALLISELDAEIFRLRAENARLRKAVDILERAFGFNGDMPGYQRRAIEIARAALEGKP